MHQKIRWGILGCGKIARKFASDIALVEDAQLEAVASRGAHAEAFAKEFGAKQSFNSYEDLVRHPDVDVIYIATPHGLHFEHTMLCLNHRKAVLCEKAFALNSQQVRTMVDFARKQNVFLMEAFWSRFLPQFELVTRMIREGAIGDIRMIQADFGFRAEDPPADRLFDPTLGGGSLLDIGIYPVFLAQALLGKPVEIQALITPHETGVDEQCVMIMKFRSGALAVLSSTFLADTPVEAVIAGTEGRIQMRNRFHNFVANVELVTGDDEIKSLDTHREAGFGFQFEARHVGECLRKGLTESPLMTLQHSLDLMETLDRVRQVAGIKYPVDLNR